ncbi:c-type cytochrome domain-containing protein [Aureliella helgolandensis]|nr:c-type cytochrome domain-containing protein [Aureliella helgolandensis]
MSPACLLSDRLRWGTRSILALCMLTWAGAAPVSAEEPVSFRRDIAPILLENCLACHGARKSEGGYRVDTFDEVQKPGDSGEGPIGHSAEEIGELVRRVAAEDASERMPVDAAPLTSEQIALMSRWIQEGAKFDGMEPNQQLALVVPPAVYPDPPANYARPVPATSVTFSPDGQQLIVGGYHELTVWNVVDGSLARRIPNIGQRVFGMKFHHDGQRLAVACGEPGQSGEVRVVDFESGKVIDVLARTHDVVLDVAFRPQTSELAVGSADGMVRIVDVDTKQELRTLSSHADWVTAVAWSPDGSRLASASRDKSVKVYDGSDGSLLASYLGHEATVQGVAFVGDGSEAVSTGDDHKLHRWTIADGKNIASVALGGVGFKPLVTPAFVLVPCADGRLLQIDLTSNSVVREFTGNSDWVLSATLQPSEQLVASGAFDGKLHVWQAADAASQRSWVAKP